jgi:transcriptional regulator with XRE-family HTH domain
LKPDEFTQAREALGLTRADLAGLFQTTDRTVRAWENDADTKWREIPFAVAVLMTMALKYPNVRRELGIKTRRKSRQAKA